MKMPVSDAFLEELDAVQNRSYVNSPAMTHATMPHTCLGVVKCVWCVVLHVLCVLMHVIRYVFAVRLKMPFGQPDTERLPPGGFGRSADAFAVCATVRSCTLEGGPLYQFPRGRLCTRQHRRKSSSMNWVASMGAIRAGTVQSFLVGSADDLSMQTTSLQTSLCSWRVRGRQRPPKYASTRSAQIVLSLRRGRRRAH